MLVEDEELDGRHRGHDQRERLPLPAGEATHLGVHHVFKAQPQGAQQLLVGLDAAAVGAGAQVVPLALVVGQRHVFKDGHRGAGAHGGVLVDAAHAAGGDEFIERIC